MPTKAQLAEINEARAQLREIVDRSQQTHDSPTIYTILRHVSSSGMSRDISLKLVDEDGELRDITYKAALALGEKPKERNGQRVIRVHGAGMDMGYHLVHSLSSVLYHEREHAGYLIDHEWA